MDQVKSSETCAENRQLAQRTYIWTESINQSSGADTPPHTICELQFSRRAQRGVQRNDDGLRLLVNEHSMPAQHKQ